ncbi:hypothetical protein VTG60DRAFT_3255 [Thermothelomyces hinnuleus]
MLYFFELEKLYWEGVGGELENIIWTLKVWQKPEFANVSVADEDDDFLHGFGTFIEQVIDESRAFAIRYGKRKDEQIEQNRRDVQLGEYAARVDELFRDLQASYASSKLKSGVRIANEVRLIALILAYLISWTAYGRYPTRCGECNLAMHVWAFPFDAWSMASLHLGRDRHMYAPAAVDPSVTASGEGATPQSWMRNRLTVLAAVTALSRAATAMAVATPGFAKATAWLHQKNGGLRGSHPGLARVKLGGIHRAQPFSHYFEAGTHSHYFLAEWALPLLHPLIR